MDPQVNNLGPPGTGLRNTIKHYNFLFSSMIVVVLL